MKRIGICGGMGSGKSKVAGMLRSLGFVVVDSDSLAKDIFAVKKNEFIIEARATGLIPIEPLDDSELKVILRNSPAARKLIEQRIHPQVLAAIKELENRIAKVSPGGFLFVESALIESHGMGPLFNAVILVAASADTAIARVAAREGVSPEQARQLLSMQSGCQSNAVQTLATDFVALVRNEGDEETLYYEVEAAMRELRLFFEKTHEQAGLVVALAKALVEQGGGTIVRERRLMELLESAYAGPGRHYHDLSHLLYCLEQLKKSRDSVTKNKQGQDHGIVSEFVAALLFHDFVYDPALKDNEGVSALLGTKFTEEFFPGVNTEKVRELILATAMHGTAGTSLTDTELLFLDIDAAVLGGAPPDYDRYATGVMREYVPLCGMDAYRAGRTKFLQSMVASQRIFHSEVFADREEYARANIARELLILN